LVQRAVTGFFFVIILVGATLLNRYSFLLLFGIVSVIGLFEFYKMAALKGHFPNKVFGTGIALFLLGLAAIHSYHLLPISTGIIMALLIALSIFLISYTLSRNTTDPFADIAYTLFGVIYVVLPFALLIELSAVVKDEEVAYAPFRVLGLFFLFWANDVGAYLVGRSIGKRKLAAHISPQKTIEGFIGGAIITIIIAYILSFQLTVYSRVDWLVLALIVAVFGTMGDLVESLFKRSVNIKDSGNILPGHGGILDRFDSQILAFPLIYAYLIITALS